MDVHETTSRMATPLSKKDNLMSKKQNKKVTTSNKSHHTTKPTGPQGASTQSTKRLRATSARTSGVVAANAAAARQPDPRLPSVGTVIQKRDRYGNVRCKCKVEKHGIRYNGTVYRSLSGAAMAAATDLGLGSPTQNGFLFWALS